MKQLFVFVFLLVGGLFTVNAADMIVLKDGSMIDAKIMEIYPAEIRYKRADNLNGPTIILPKDRVLSIKYENGIVEVINASPAAGQERSQTAGAGSHGDRQLGPPTPLQVILNTLPAIPIAGNNLKFQFGGDSWIATINGENFLMGTIELEDTDDGSLLTLKQTHIWPGAVGRTAGRLARRIPGGAAVGGVLDTAGSIAGAAGAIEASGPVIVLEYKAGPPAKLSFVRSTREAADLSDTQMTGDHPLVASNRFDLDGFNAFAISFPIMPTYLWGAGGGITLTVFESYKPNTFFTPSYFLSGKFIFIDMYDNKGYDSKRYGEIFLFDLGAGVLFKHRFPKNRILWNSGASLEFMWADGNLGENYPIQGYNGGYFTGNEYVNYRSSSFLFGMGIQTGFSFRFNPYTSLDLNGLVKFPFGKLKMKQEPRPYFYGYETQRVFTVPPPEYQSHWPFTGGFELGLTLWFPYRSRK
jgi:hypothetical protein